MASVAKTARGLVRRALAGAQRPAGAKALSAHYLVAPRPLQTRCFASAPTDKDDEFVDLRDDKAQTQPSSASTPAVTHAEVLDDDLDEEDDDMEEVVAIGPSGIEYGGPTRGGKFKEPTRYGDWERKGRCSDF